MLTLKVEILLFVKPVVKSSVLLILVKHVTFRSVLLSVNLFPKTYQSLKKKLMLKD